MKRIVAFAAVNVLLIVGLAVAQVDDVGPVGLAKARKDIAQFLVDKKPSATSKPVIESGTYFLDQFKKEREVKGIKKVGPASIPFEGKQAVADTDKKLIVCLEISEAMRKTAEEAADDAADLPAKWQEAQKEVLDKLSTKNKKQKQSAMSDVERLTWEQFLTEWQKDATQADATRFNDALVQAAYEIAKAGSDITTVQETVAQEAQPASPATGATGTGSSGHARPGGYYHSDVVHERLMNGIYRRHHRRMNKITRIRARSGSY